MFVLLIRFRARVINCGAVRKEQCSARCAQARNAVVTQPMEDLLTGYSY